MANPLASVMKVVGGAKNVAGAVSSKLQNSSMSKMASGMKSMTKTAMATNTAINKLAKTMSTTNKRTFADIEESKERFAVEGKRWETLFDYLEKILKGMTGLGGKGGGKGLLEQLIDALKSLFGMLFGPLMTMLTGLAGKFNKGMNEKGREGKGEKSGEKVSAEEAERLADKAKERAEKSREMAEDARNEAEKHREAYEKARTVGEKERLKFEIEKNERIASHADEQTRIAEGEQEALREEAKRTRAAREATQSTKAEPAEVKAGEGESTTKEAINPEKLKENISNTKRRIRLVEEKLPLLEKSGASGEAEAAKESLRKMKESLSSYEAEEAKINKPASKANSKTTTQSNSKTTAEAKYTSGRESSPTGLGKNSGGLGRQAFRAGAGGAVLGLGFEGLLEAVNNVGSIGTDEHTKNRIIDSAVGGAISFGGFAAAATLAAPVVTGIGTAAGGLVGAGAAGTAFGGAVVPLAGIALMAYDVYKRHRDRGDQDRVRGQEELLSTLEQNFKTQSAASSLSEQEAELYKDTDPERYDRTIKQSNNALGSSLSQLVRMSATFDAANEVNDILPMEKAFSISPYGLWDKESTYNINDLENLVRNVDGRPGETTVEKLNHLAGEQYELNEADRNKPFARMQTEFGLPKIAELLDASPAIIERMNIVLGKSNTEHVRDLIQRSQSDARIEEQRQTDIGNMTLREHTDKTRPSIGPKFNKGGVVPSGIKGDIPVNVHAAEAILPLQGTYAHDSASLIGQGLLQPLVQWASSKMSGQLHSATMSRTSGSSSPPVMISNDNRSYSSGGGGKGAYPSVNSGPSIAGYEELFAKMTGVYAKGARV